MPQSRPPQLRLESLDERIVPALVNLTTLGAQGTLNGAMFQQRSGGPDDDASHTFLRLQESNFFSSLFTGEEGYNTSARPLQFDAVGGTNVTRSLKLSEIPEVTINGVSYREFLLTTNQPNNSPTITLEELRIFVSSNGALRGYNTSNGRLAGLTATYNMDAGGNNSVRINDNLNKVDADVRVLIPSSALGSNPDAYIYLYSKFSSAPLTSIFSRAESWAVNEPQTSAPTPATLSGRIYLDADRSRDITDGDFGLGQVRVFLNGTDVNGNTVSLETTTDDQGFFTFSDSTLLAGTYTISEEANSGFRSFDSTSGSNGGDDSTPGTISDITLSAGSNATGYLFGEEFFEGS